MQTCLGPVPNLAPLQIDRGRSAPGRACCAFTTALDSFSGLFCEVGCLHVRGYLGADTARSIGEWPLPRDNLFE